MELLDLLRMLQRRWRLILIVFAVTVALGMWITMKMTPIYEASANILIKGAGSTPLDLDMPVIEALGGMGRNSLQNYVEILKSRSLAEKVVAKLMPDVFLTPEDQDELTELMKVRRLRQWITVASVPGSDIISINVQHRYPEYAALIANIMVDVFIEENKKSSQQSVRSAKEFIEVQLKSFEEKLNMAEEALLAFQKSEKIYLPTAETEAYVDKIAKLEAMKAEAELFLRDAKARVEKIKAQHDEESQRIISSMTEVNNPLLNEYRSRLVQLETSLAGALEKYTEEHPTVLSLKAEIANLQEKIAKEAPTTIGSQTTTINPVYQDLALSLIKDETLIIGLEAKIAGLEKAIKESEMEFSELPHKELQYARLLRDQKVSEQIYVMLMEKLEEYRIAEAMNIEDIQIIDTAAIPLTPVKPKKLLNIALSVCLGLFVGCGLAFLIECFDTTIRTVDEIEAEFGIPILGQIPVMKAKSTGRHGSHHSGKRRRKEASESGRN